MKAGLEIGRQTLLVALAFFLAGAALPSPSEAGSLGSDPNIQQKVELFTWKPTGEELVIKPKPKPGKPKPKKSAATATD